MANVFAGSEDRLVGVLDEAWAECQATGRLDRAAWLARHPDMAVELPPLLDTVRALALASQDWRSLADGLGVPAGVNANPLPAMIGRYHILDRCGAGGMGTVFKAHDPSLGRVVALKVPRLDPTGSAHATAVQRFLREARTAARVRHPHVCPIHDVGEADGIPYAVMSYVAGPTLATYRSEHSFRPAEAADLVRKVALGLQAIHDEGIIHRDLKPGNILLEVSGQSTGDDPRAWRLTPFLTDFGLALQPAEAEPLTQTGDVLGTPAYMAPEQAAGEPGRADARGDIYSLGVILYELLTSERPFQGSARMVLRQVLDEEPRPPRALNEQVPADLETVCLKAMAKDPAGRYPTAAAMAEDLQRFLDGRPVLARPVGQLGKLRRWCRRRPLTAGLAALLLVVLVVGFAGVTWQWRRAEREWLRAEDHFRIAHEALNAATGLDNVDLGRNILLSRTQQKQVKRLINHYEYFVAQHQGDQRLRFDVAFAYQALGNYWLQEKDLTQAADYYQKAIAAWEELRAEDESAVRNQLGLAGSHFHLARLYADAGDSLAAIRHAQESCRTYDHILARDPANPHIRIHLADAQFLLANRFKRGRQPLEAAAVFAQLYQTLRRLAQDPALQQEPKNAAAVNIRSRGVSLAYSSADTLADLKKPDQARAFFDLSRQLLQPLLREKPSAAERHLAQIKADYFEGILKYESGAKGDALTAFQRGCRAGEQAVRDVPGSLPLKEALARCSFWIGKLADEKNRFPQVLQGFGRAAELYEELAKAKPKDTYFLGSLANSYHIIGRTHLDDGRPAQALPALRRAIALREAVSRLRPTDAQLQKDVAGTRKYLDEAQQRLRAASPR